jgi:cysteine sulfinate desulfinase/cysteine desulfurase-like protein
MIRISFGIYNTEEEVDTFLESLPRTIEAAKKDQEEQNNAEDLIREIDPAY